MSKMRLSKRSRTHVILLACFVSIVRIRQTYNQTVSPKVIRRAASLYLGDGQCRYEEPTTNIPDVDLKRTLVAGFPSGDKRLTFLQMEALTGLAAKDEWDFAYLGISGEPFVKANYPHHEGIWGWEQQVDQVIMIIRNIRRSLVEYHDILWDIDYAKTWEEATMAMENLYQERPPLDDFLVWRDERVLDEIHWYGWFIEYWMEGGLMRDMFSTNITTPEHWDMLMQPTRYQKEEMTYDLIVGDAEVTPSYDPHCTNDVSGSCVPLLVISGERLVNHDTGPAESRKLAELLMESNGINDFVIQEDAWECIWEELIIHKKGLKTFMDREGLEERDYNFSEEMLSKMIQELSRLIAKFSEPVWAVQQIANDLVELLTEHRQLIQEELDEVVSGARRLEWNDILGPNTRKRRMHDMRQNKMYWK